MSVVKSLIATSLAFGLVLLSGCEDDEPDTVAPLISTLSHADNDKVFGDRTISFVATITDQSDLSVEVTHNGNMQTVTTNTGANTFSASITLEDDENNTIVVTATDSEGNSTTQSIALNYPYFRFTDGQNASVVIGQPDFTSGAANQGGVADANTIYQAEGRHIVINGVLYIADTRNNRILGFNSVPTTANAMADFVIGQPDFTTTTAGIANNQLERPYTIETDGTKFFVAMQGDVNQGRIHVWNSIPTSNVPADYVIGQPDFNQNDTNTCTYNRIGNKARDVFVINNKLMIADTTQNRVLVWDQIPENSNQPATFVLGQKSFTVCETNDDDGDGFEDSPTASTFVKPQSIWTDGERLAIADLGNFRALFWSNFPSQNAQPADLVLGQDTMFTNEYYEPPVTSTKYHPYYLTSNGNQLFVADRRFFRVLVWNSWPSSDNVAPDQVLGNNDFVTEVSAITQSTFSAALGLYLNNNQLFVSDFVTGGHRVLIFNSQ